MRGYIQFSGYHSIVSGATSHLPWIVTHTNGQEAHVGYSRRIVFLPGCIAMTCRTILVEDEVGQCKIKLR